MGCCVLGPQASGPGSDHWFEMLNNARRPVAQWYSLQENIASAVSATTATARQQRDKRRPNLNKRK